MRCVEEHVDGGAGKLDVLLLGAVATIDGIVTGIVIEDGGTNGVGAGALA